MGTGRASPYHYEAFLFLREALDDLLGVRSLVPFHGAGFRDIPDHLFLHRQLYPQSEACKSTLLYNHRSSNVPIGYKTAIRTFMHSLRQVVFASKYTIIRTSLTGKISINFLKINISLLFFQKQALRAIACRLIVSSTLRSD